MYGNNLTLPLKTLLSLRKFQALTHKRDATMPADDHVQYPDVLRFQISKSDFFL